MLDAARKVVTRSDTTSRRGGLAECYSRNAEFLEQNFGTMCHWWDRVRGPVWASRVLDQTCAHFEAFRFVKGVRDALVRIGTKTSSIDTMGDSTPFPVPLVTPHVDLFAFELDDIQRPDFDVLIDAMRAEKSRAIEGMRPEKTPTRDLADCGDSPAKSAWQHGPPPVGSFDAGEIVSERQDGILHAMGREVSGEWVPLKRDRLVEMNDDGRVWVYEDHRGFILHLKTAAEAEYRRKKLADFKPKKTRKDPT